MTPEAEEERIYKVSEIKRICAERDALVQSLDEILTYSDNHHRAREIARVALAKVKK